MYLLLFVLSQKGLATLSWTQIRDQYQPTKGKNVDPSSLGQKRPNITTQTETRNLADMIKNHFTGFINKCTLG